MKYRVKDSDESMTIKEILKERIGISSRLYTRLKKNKKIVINGEVRMPHENAKTGDIINLDFDYEKNTFDIEEHPLDIIYEDEVLIIVNKDPFYVVHPTKGHPTGTLMNFVGFHMAEQKDFSKIRFVNRLDRDTSGIVIMAKNQFIHHQLSEAMREKTIDKTYIALVKGVVEKDEQLIDLPIDREDVDSIKRMVREDGKPCQTKIKVIKRFVDYTLLEVKLLTGRTHQIRVHLTHIGHPIVGDELYNEHSDLIDRQFLHCTQMAFKHPLTDEYIKVNAEYKEDMNCCLKQIGGVSWEESL